MDGQLLILADGPPQLIKRVVFADTLPERIDFTVPVTAKHCDDPACPFRVVTGTKVARYVLGRTPAGEPMKCMGVPAFFFDCWQPDKK
jgi:hypothetical protein